MTDPCKYSGRDLADYPRDKCQHDSMTQMAMAMNGENPCARCNMDRSICGGHPRYDQPEKEAE